MSNKIAEPSPLECDICNEKVGPLKVFPCSHEMCETCYTRLPGNRVKVCPFCRHSLPTTVKNCPSRYDGSLECSLCLSLKAIGDTWWCEPCRELICSRCHIKSHAATGHSIEEFLSGDVVAASVNYLSSKRELSKAGEKQNEDRIARAMAKVTVELQKRLVPKKNTRLEEELKDKFGWDRKKREYNWNPCAENEAKKMEKVVNQCAVIAGIPLDEKPEPVSHGKVVESELFNASTIAELLLPYFSLNHETPKKKVAESMKRKNSAQGPGRGKKFSPSAIITREPNSPPIFIKPPAI